MSSDVCKHCTHAACLDVCPTGSLFRTEFGTVVVQEDICNGCGYCVPGLPVRRHRPAQGRRPGVEVHAVLRPAAGTAWTPACAKACPTESIQFGAAGRAARAGRRSASAELHEQGVDDARLYGADPDDGVGGAGAFFLLLDEPEVYGLPPDPVVTTRDLPAMWRHVGGRRRGARAAVAAASFLGGRR